MKEEFGTDKMINGLPAQDKFINYDDVVLSKISIENKDDFAQ